jgi:D-alanyl-D-alanine carboxypeptidase/D-alanyl-D-alanine-endopeptidase (penicillin-binding protein 4)
VTDPRDPFGDEFPPTEPFTPPGDEDRAAVEQPTAAMAAPTGPTGPARAWAGILTSIRTHPRSWIAAGATAAFLLIGGGSFAAGAAAAPEPQPAALAAPVHSATPTASATPTPTPTGRPTPNPAAPATALKTCSVAGAAADGRLGTLEAQVVDPKTGQVLFDRKGDTPAPTASVMKTITAGAALTALGADTQIPTVAVKGAEPGQVVIVGGGDPTLGTGRPQWFQGAPTLTDLAAQVKKAWAADPANAGHPITSVVADSSLFSGPLWQSSWDEQAERESLGSTAYIAPLMADGDKRDPSKLESPRGTDPVGDAAKAFAQDLGAKYDGAGSAPQGAAQLGVVKSQPISSLVTEALQNSDNTVMEMLARLTAIKMGAGNTFGAIDAGDTAALKKIGVDTTGLTIVDGSGLSGDNRVPPAFLTAYLTKVLNRESGLGVIYDALPVSGQSGTLSKAYGRFAGPAAVAVGHVHAKTGSINGAYTLAGTIDAKDGTTLVFAMYALGNVGDSARAALDALAAAVYNCGGNLSNS